MDKPSSSITRFYEAANALSKLPKPKDGRDPERMVDDLIDAFQEVIADMNFHLSATQLQRDVFEEQTAEQIRKQTFLGKPRLQVIEGGAMH